MRKFFKFENGVFIEAPNKYIAQKIAEEDEVCPFDSEPIEAIEKEIDGIYDGSIYCHNFDASQGDTIDHVLEYFNNFLKGATVGYDDPNNREEKKIKELSWDPRTDEPYVELEDGTWAHLPFLFLTNNQDFDYDK